MKLIINKYNYQFILVPLVYPRVISYCFPGDLNIFIKDKRYTIKVYHEENTFFLLTYCGKNLRTDGKVDYDKFKKHCEKALDNFFSLDLDNDGIVYRKKLFGNFHPVGKTGVTLIKEPI
jgi:hypothetical protein